MGSVTDLKANELHCTPDTCSDADHVSLIQFMYVNVNVLYLNSYLATLTVGLLQQHVQWVVAGVGTECHKHEYT